MRTRVIAHRGARSLAPENTLAAARAGYEVGADLWETDVNITRDGRLILFHDPTLERCTDVCEKFPDRDSYRVRDFTLGEIQELDSGSYFIATDPFDQIRKGRISPELLAGFRGERVPTLVQGLDLVKDLDWAVNLELKHFPPESSANPDPGFILPDLTLKAVNESGIDTDRVCISSFHHDWLVHIRNAAPHIAVQALIGEDGCDRLDFSDLCFDTYNANASLITPEQIADLRSLGISVNLFTVNDPETFHRFSALGVDGIFTDFPQRFTG